MLNLRWMRTHLARWVPERVKAPFRARLFGYRGHALEPGKLDSGAECVDVSFLGLEFRAPHAAYDDLLYHVADNGDSIEELDAVIRIARETGGTLLDVGAARGLISTVFCLARDGNRAVAMEPSPVQVRDAREMAALNGIERRLEVRQVAAGREPGEARGGVDEMGLIDFSPPRGVQTFAVLITTLDDEVRRMGRAPEVVKIDVEGHELEVLRGARELLARKPVLLLELHLDLLDHGGGDGAEALVELLAGHGYHFETSAGQPLSARAVLHSPNAVLRLVAR
ncbi:FkbM family methyltransferase [Longimicrobium sp.]|uniref:FkbM family methyltransferase n=1 Tax=Longimicrobium sp. TaxID=2029185 RepID=UPI002CF54C3F|nr:FkbM family methyltransferase [Longimicrobium sp.]HSU15213.1 FkbM family methyltransferase [Longimicrobium sp.]